MSRRKLSARDFAALNAGRTPTVKYRPDGRAEVKIPGNRPRARVRTRVRKTPG